MTWHGFFCGLKVLLYLICESGLGTVIVGWGELF